ncbi:MAG: hypothetical protein ACQEVA_21795 [Myxococcota bacterium]
MRIRAASVGSSDNPANLILIQEITSQRELERNNQTMMQSLRSMLKGDQDALTPRSLELSVSSPIEGAKVEINGESYGKLPAKRTRRFQLDWPDDALIVVISHPNYEDFVARFPASALGEQNELQPTQSDFAPRTDDG